MENTQQTSSTNAFGHPIVIASKALFGRGRLRIEPGARRELMARYGSTDAAVQAALGFVVRHQGGDWSEMSEADARANKIAVAGGMRVLSEYIMQPLPGEAAPVKIWFLTTADRSLTTVLLPEEY